MYVKSVIVDRTASISNPIKKNKLYLFGKQSVRAKSKQAKTITALQNNVTLFAQLYIAMQSRDVDLEDFFSHEVQSFPAALSEFGSLRLSTAKSDLLKCIVKPHQFEPQVQFDAGIFDGAVVVHALPVTGVNKFEDYADNVFIPYLSGQRSQRVDVIWDSYVPDSLKEATRQLQKRGKGIRRNVSGGTKLPSKWIDFLRDSVNKQELFQFLTSKVAVHNWSEEKIVCITSGKYLYSSYYLVFPIVTGCLINSYALYREFRGHCWF